jgi:hypothetical protein
MVVEPVPANPSKHPLSHALVHTFNKAKPELPEMAKQLTADLN